MRGVGNEFSETAGILGYYSLDEKLAQSVTIYTKNSFEKQQLSQESPK
jgi:hypothetical protein